MRHYAVNESGRGAMPGKLSPARSIESFLHRAAEHDRCTGERQALERQRVPCEPTAAASEATARALRTESSCLSTDSVWAADRRFAPFEATSCAIGNVEQCLRNETMTLRKRPGSRFQRTGCRFEGVRASLQRHEVSVRRRPRAVSKLR